MVWIILDGQIVGLLGNSFILLLCQRHYQTFRPDKNFRIRKPNLVSHEVPFQEDQPGFGQRCPNVWTVFNMAFFQGLI
jgi:hypothetical protein